MTIFFALLPAYILSIFYRSFLSVIAGPVMADLKIGPAEFGTLGAAWFITFAAAQFPVGWALDRLGPRRTVGTAMAIGTAGAFLFATSENAWVAVFAMGLVGIGCSPIFMSALYLFARTQDVARFGVLSSVFIGLGSLGNLVGAAPLALAAQSFGWRATMLGFAAMFLLATVLAAVLVRDPPVATDASGRQEGLLQGLKSIVSIGPLWLLAPITLVGYAIIATARGLWIAPYMTQVHGLDAVMAGHATLGMATTMVVGAFVYGALQKRTGRSKPLVAWGTAATGVGFALLALLGERSMPGSVLLFAIVGGTGFTYAILMAHARIFFPEHLVGRGMTFVNFLFIAGAAMVQFGSGWFIAMQRGTGHDAATAFANLHWVFAALLLASTAIYLLTPERKAA
ncbi:MAG: MFS transporter [Bosea sp.]|uniref:MFS transporter n=1 Tax=Bosea sp. (in: a-proteobacteria) TaxID=1871050 RepID=UPI001AC9A6C2|nr:MFS transporter [Bosea sp. (in: a-proteobacteria)]MBN9468253.1 MFS transporter [Bosea sp. (in: a-proteobacteria)]